MGTGDEIAEDLTGCGANLITLAYETQSIFGGVQTDGSFAGFIRSGCAAVDRVFYGVRTVSVARCSAADHNQDFISVFTVAVEGPAQAGRCGPLQAADHQISSLTKGCTA